MSMELIDRKQLQIETQILEDVGQSEMQFYSVEQVDNAPTVKAIPKDQINKAIEKIEQYICDVETDTVKAQGMAQALDMFEQSLKPDKK